MNRRPSQEEKAGHISGFELLRKLGEKAPRWELPIKKRGMSWITERNYPAQWH